MDTPNAAAPSWLSSSTTIAQLATALAAAQGEMEDASKDRRNDHFGSRYADLASVVQAVRAPLSKHGIAFVQPAEWREGRLTVRTVLVHKSGEWMASELSAKPQQDTPQGIGSTITYLRRYSLMSMTGIAPDDDDGEAGEGRGGAAKRPTKEEREAAKRQQEQADAQRRAAHDGAWAKEQAGFFAQLKTLGVDYEREVKPFCEHLQRPKPSEMTSEDRARLLSYLGTDAGKNKLMQFLTGAAAK